MIKLAFALTINKAQGQTLQYMGLYLPRPVFSHGQLYVALSRVGSKERITIMVLGGKALGVEGVHTKNVVYREVFTSAWTIDNLACVCKRCQRGILNDTLD